MLRPGLCLLFCLSLTVSANAAATNDKRPAQFDPKPRQHYCIRNAESGACEDCWSQSRHGSVGGTCKGLKSATNDPNVRKGSCSQYIKTSFCRTPHPGSIP